MGASAPSLIMAATACSLQHWRQSIRAPYDTEEWFLSLLNASKWWSVPLSNSSGLVSSVFFFCCCFVLFSLRLHLGHFNLNFPNHFLFWICEFFSYPSEIPLTGTCRSLTGPLSYGEWPQTGSVTSPGHTASSRCRLHQSRETAYKTT